VDIDMEAWSIVAVVLLAVLVGAVLPVLFQFYRTLGSTRRLMDHLDTGLKTTLKEVEEASGRLNRIAEALEESTPQIRDAMAAVGGLGRTVSDARKSLLSAASIGGTLAPVVAAAVQAFRGSCGDTCAEDGNPGPVDGSVEPEEAFEAEGDG
jgi:uncharacterized protein YoxC